MVQTVTRRADIWSLAAGILMIIFGIYICSHPGVALLGIALYLGLALIVIGAVHLLQNDYLIGIVDILIGIILVANLGITAATLPYVFAIWCLVVGVTQLYLSYDIKDTYSLWYWPLLSGLVGVIIGILILIYPMFGFLTIPLLLGIYMLMYGVLVTIEYFQGRNI